MTLHTARVPVEADGWMAVVGDVRGGALGQVAI